MIRTCLITHVTTCVQGFWEGGAGCRDTNLMSHKDSRKYRSGATKTQSQKSKRVGLAAKLLREERKRVNSGSANDV